MSLIWFRQDLRLRDNPALAAALASGGPVVPVYIWDEAGEGEWPIGGASRWWLHHSLTALDRSLRERGSRLVIRRGPSGEALAELAAETGAEALTWNRRYEPAARQRDTAIKRTLAGNGLAVTSHNAALLFEPHAIANRQGGPFQVFSPFWRHCQALPVAEPLRLPPGPLPAPRRWPRSLAVEELGLLPAHSWADEFSRHWNPGEEGARERLRQFAAQAAAGYAQDRNFPAVDGSSRLSPWLHFGEVGPRQIWAAFRRRSRESGIFPAGAGETMFLNELGWREFAHHLLYHFPLTPSRPLRPAFERFPWAGDPGGKRLGAWRQGRTGYPIVDAGLRQLWRTGWMHNRVRMIAASFLVKHLRLQWQQGAAWFWDTLVDADLANNTLGWQWSAGCGADAAPYFRIFAPVLQGKKFDPEGVYVKRWVPELKGVPARWVHCPWEAPPSVLADAGVTIGSSYPPPIVDHAEARGAALAAFRSISA